MTAEHVSQDFPPTLDDVARLAMVSTATVSRCLNQAEKVSEGTRKRVMQAVETLGYTPNFSARALAAKRTHTVGAIIPTLANDIFARGLQAFQETLNDRGYTLLVSCTDYDPEQEAEQIRTLVARGADGLLLIGYERDESLHKYLENRGIPYLISWAHRADQPQPAIGFDNRKSMFELTKEVLEKGHREIAIISAVRSGNDRVAERVRGIHQALAEVGIDPVDIPLIETPYSVANGADAFEKLMDSDRRPSVVMCGNDVLAVGALQRARQMGLRVPQDVSITGCDDIEIASVVTPKLTTIHVPLGQMGRQAAEGLIDMIETKGSAGSVELMCSIRLRDSLGSVVSSAGVNS